MIQARIDLSDIKQLLPHRNPFLFVDKIVGTDETHRIIAEKYLAHDSDFFKGHFPDQPMMPGVLISEALAQTGGILIGIRLGKKTGAEAPSKSGVFLTSVNMKYLQPAFPGQTLRLEAELKKEFAGMYLFNVSAFVAGIRIAQGSLSLARREAIKK